MFPLVCVLFTFCLGFGGKNGDTKGWCYEDNLEKVCLFGVTEKGCEVNIYFYKEFICISRFRSEFPRDND